MKINKAACVLLGLAASCMPASATISLSTGFGVAKDINGTAVPDGTLWALIVDSSGDSTFGGTFGINGSLQTFWKSGPGAGEIVRSTFTGRSIALGTTFGGDTVFALGGFNGVANSLQAGISIDTVSGTLGQLGLAENRNFAFLFFPGVEFTSSAASYQIGYKMGGVQSAFADAGAGTGAMVIPADGSSGVSVGAATAGDLGGSYPSVDFLAVDIGPEPSAAFLAVLGALGFLRRGR